MIIVGTPRSRGASCRNVTDGVCLAVDGRVKPDRNRNAANTYLVESLCYFLPNKLSSVPESNPNSEDEKHKCGEKGQKIPYL